MILTEILKNGANKHPDAPALTMKMGFRTVTMTYRQVYDRSRKIALLLALPIVPMLLVGCGSVEDLTGNNPIVDNQGVSQARYEQDLAECRAYADQVDIARKATTGVVSGAVVGGVFAWRSGLFGLSGQDSAAALQDPSSDELTAAATLADLPPEERGRPDEEQQEDDLDDDSHPGP